MANVRVKETTYRNNLRSIVKFPDHYVNTTCVLPATSAVTDADGKRLFKAGTCIKNFSYDPAVCTEVTDAFDAVIFNDQEVAYGETAVTVTILIHGFVRSRALVPIGTTVLASDTDLIVVL